MELDVLLVQQTVQKYSPQLLLIISVCVIRLMALVRTAVLENGEVFVISLALQIVLHVPNSQVHALVANLDIMVKIVQNSATVLMDACQVEDAHVLLADGVLSVYFAMLDAKTMCAMF